MVATRATRFSMWIDSLTEAYPATGASLMGPSTPGRVRRPSGGIGQPRERGSKKSGLHPTAVRQSRIHPR
jgi:hypothetical protein